MDNRRQRVEEKQIDEKATLREAVAVRRPRGGARVRAGVRAGAKGYFALDLDGVKCG